MAYSEQDWAIVKAFYERGLSLSEIIERPEVAIKAKSQISRKATKEGWQKATDKQQLIELEVQTKQNIKELHNKKATLNATELIVHNELVDERTKHINFFNHAAITNVKQAMAEPCENQNDFRARAETINKGREAVLGKTPDSSVNVQVNTGAQPSDSAKDWLESVVSTINAG